MKVKYYVFKRYYFYQEEPEEHYFHKEWEYVGKTFAVSEKQAVNNVRHRVNATSQHKPVNVSGHWENGFEWKASQSWLK